MPIRRFNFTKRKRIRREHARISICRSSTGVPSFDADICLESYGLPADALVFIEAYRQTSWMRFSWGSVSRLSQPTDRRLVDFGEPDGVLFRVRVTSAGERAGLLLAQADGISATDPLFPVERGRIPLLPVRLAKDLGDEVYRVDFEGQRPMLLVNDRLGDWRAVAREDVFQALVYPAIVREILTRVVMVEGHAPDEDDEDWRNQWLTFARRVSGNREIAGGEWITDVVEAFTRQQGTVEKMKSHLER